MFTMLGSSIGAFLAAKRSHFAILAICAALILRSRTTNDELLTALGMLCGGKDQGRGPMRAGRRRALPAAGVEGLELPAESAQC